MSDHDEIIMIGFDEPVQASVESNPQETIEELEQMAREAYRRGDNSNPFIVTPEGLNATQLEDWENREEAWAMAWIAESRKKV